MMDPLSVSASIIAILQLSGTLVGYIRDVKDASEDQRRILHEVTMAMKLFERLKQKAERKERNDTWSEELKLLNERNGPLEQVNEALTALGSLVKPEKGLRKVVKRLAWPFRKNNAKDILLVIERLKSHFIILRQEYHM
jgi:hypothetical protein